MKITDVTVVTVINLKRHWQNHGRLNAVRISKHSLFRLKITVGCLTCFVLCVHEGVVLCGVAWCVFVVCVVLVLCGVVLVLCGVGGGVVWCGGGGVCVFFSQFSSFSFLLSLFLSSFFSSSLFSSLLSLLSSSSLLATKHCEELINQHGVQLRGV